MRTLTRSGLAVLMTIPLAACGGNKDEEAAARPEDKVLFVNFPMEPAVMAGVKNSVEYANGNAASLPFGDETLRNDPAVYPAGEDRRKLHPVHVDSQEYSRNLNRAWMRVRTGQ